MLQKPFISEYKERKHFTPKKKSFLMSLFLSSCFSSQTRIDLVLVKFYCNAAVWRFLKTFRKFAGKRLWWKRYLGKFKLFKMDSGKGVCLSVFWKPFSGYFQTLIWGIRCFVIGENLRKQALLRKFNAAHLRKRKSNSRFMKP